MREGVIEVGCTDKEVAVAGIKMTEQYESLSKGKGCKRGGGVGVNKWNRDKEEEEKKEG